LAGRGTISRHEQKDYVPQAIEREYGYEEPPAPPVTPHQTYPGEARYEYQRSLQTFAGWAEVCSDIDNFLRLEVAEEGVELVCLQGQNSDDDFLFNECICD
jgi:hypothetical protein